MGMTTPHNMHQVEYDILVLTFQVIIQNLQTFIDRWVSTASFLLCKLRPRVH